MRAAAGEFVQEDEVMEGVELGRRRAAPLRGPASPHPVRHTVLGALAGLGEGEGGGAAFQ